MFAVAESGVEDANIVRVWNVVGCVGWASGTENCEGFLRVGVCGFYVEEFVGCGGGGGGGRREDSGDT